MNCKLNQIRGKIQVVNFHDKQVFRERIKLRGPWVESLINIREMRRGLRM